MAWTEETPGQGLADQLRGVADIQQLHDVGAVHLHGPRADAESSTDLPVGQSSGHEMENLSLAWGQDHRPHVLESLTRRSHGNPSRPLPAMDGV